jgi:hypothetical protein
MMGCCGELCVGGIRTGRSRTVHGRDVAEHAVGWDGRGDRIGQADLGLRQLVLV